MSYPVLGTGLPMELTGSQGRVRVHYHPIFHLPIENLLNVYPVIIILHLRCSDSLSQRSVLEMDRLFPLQTSLSSD